MKKITIAMAALLVTAGLVASFAFTSEKSHKPFATKYQAYTRGNNVIALSGTDHIVGLQLADNANWIDSTAILLHANTSRLKAISFNDAEITVKQDAFDAVSNYFIDNSGTLPSDGSTLPVVVGTNTFFVTVYRMP